MKAVLPVAGNGTRMYPLGVDTPKALIRILNKPLLLWSLEALQVNGITEVVVVTSAGVFGTMIKDYVSTLSLENLTIHVAIQKQQLGTANVLQMAKDFFTDDEDFIFLNGDDLYGPENIRLLTEQRGNVVLGMQVNDPEKWGIFQANENGDLIQVIEKPTQFVGDLANIGCMRLNSEVFKLYEQIQISSRGEYELTDTLQLLAKQGKIKVAACRDYWIPIGYPWHILEAAEYFLPKIESKIEGVVEENVVQKGKLILPQSSTILAGSYLDGNICVGENTVIGPHAYIRGNVSIGSGCKIGASVELKNSVIGNDTRVPHLSYVGDSVIGDDVNVAAQSSIANFRHDQANISTPIKGKLTDTGRQKLGAILANHVRLGIGTIIYPGRKIWPGKTTIPGQVVSRDITD